ncbi:fatty acid desaturase family protein [Acidisoma cellulosilytica]|uniref:Fatty acid desaturase family protein n=1 Tax=Acidisoma cellulosilyticum TaxID=2802395 RepID=A0A963Z3Z5_9PROT|nr:fatty acid desaturase family protein [Acidisoma cellulosilyticum]MCB8882096.1 fatty acid desaturase family protein [Acidisoma cellulosilyticum]
MTTTARDYSLTGMETRRAEARGLASADWYAHPIPRKQMKALMRRKDGPAIRDTAIWLGTMLVCAGFGIHLWGSWLAVPFFIVYGVLYGSASDSRWHECGHGTAFKTAWMNDVVYNIACFMIMREPTVWRWSHTRHHTDTIIVGRDPEISVKRPPDIAGILLNLFALKSSYFAIRKLALHASGRLTDEEKTFIPETEQKKVYVIARIYLAILFAVALLSFVLRSWIPAMLVGLPTLYGGYLTVIYGVTQHAGLSEDVLDHRLNSRTVYMNPISRFLYWNMNYHVEHHMFPMVPYHALPALHDAIKDECPDPYPSIIAAYAEIIPALLKQRSDPHYFVRRELPGKTGLPEVASLAQTA